MGSEKPHLGISIGHDGRAALAGIGGFESADLIRAEREARDAGDRRR
jgi:hypothetical protein